jgi:nicotinamide mononucleotide (NMN) deamidase PncC
MPDVLSASSWRLWYHAKALLDAFARFGVTQVHATHEHIHAAAATTGLVLAAAFIAVPGASTVLIIKAVTILAATQRARLMLVGELVRRQAAKMSQQVRPPAVG